MCGAKQRCITSAFMMCSSPRACIYRCLPQWVNEILLDKVRGLEIAVESHRPGLLAQMIMRHMIGLGGGFNRGVAWPLR